MSQSIVSIKEINQPLDNIIYKVKHLVNNEIDTIYVFYGEKNLKGDSREDDEIIKKLFTDEEDDEIKKNKTNIVFSQQRIHPDDSIATIKIKILNEMVAYNKTLNVSLEELYLFCKKVEKLNSVALYQSLTQNKKIALTKVRLDQFLSNVYEYPGGKSISEPENKDLYSYDDIFEMKLDNKDFIVNKVLGQKFFIVENEYPFVSNPYDAKEYDKFLEKNSRKSLTTLNNHLLLNSGEILDNSIYVCLAPNVLTYLEEKELSEETTTKIYYPFLYNKNINGNDDLEKLRDKLLQGDKKLNTERTLNNFRTVNMFYDIYHLRKSELNYVGKGIKYIKAVMKPDFDVKIPLEIIFKIVHANESNPLIKYNPSSRQENIYRLYTDKISTDGRKIPYLKKAVIFKLIKAIGRTKSVSVYIETSDSQILNCEFDEEGYITMTANFNRLVSIEEVDNIFKKTINPIIQEIKTVLEQSGYKLSMFSSLSDENMEIKNMTYETQVLINKAFDIDAYRGCISAIFINESSKVKGKNKVNLRFKRVSNYSKFTSQEAFILEKSEQGLRGEEIISALLENFPDDLTREQAIDMVRKVANELEVERGVRKSDIKIKENPGFKTEIVLDLETATLHITTENINNVNYLYTLPIYLDTMVRLTQDKTSTNYPIVEMNKFCSAGEDEIVDVLFPDITSSTEESAIDGEDAEIEGDEIVEYTRYTEMEREKPKGALSLFFDEDEEESEDYELEGGKDSDESEESVTSESLSKSSEKEDKREDKKEDKKATGEKEENVDVSFPSSISSEETKPIVTAQMITKPDSESSLSSIESLKKETVISEKPYQLESLPSSPSSSEELEDSTPIPVLSPKDSINQKEEETSKEGIQLIIESESNRREKSDKKSDKEDKKSDKKEDEDYEKEESEEEDVDVRKIDGKKLNKPYYFQTLIEKKDPILILKEDTKEYNGYSRTCLSDKRRQPVILTDNQLEKINKENPGFLREQDVIKYGSDEKHQFNYICPRYWCLKNNTIVDPKDLKQVKGKDGKIELVHPTCGKVLPKKEKKVLPGYYIYEFNEKYYPGLIPDRHPDGLCLPCCFKNYNTEGRIKSKERCQQQKLVKGKDAKKEGKRTEVPEKEEGYVLGPEKFPLEPGRWGYLPVEIQTMLHESSADCQVSKMNTSIKSGHPCLLRHGIEVDKKQSFVSCISDAIFFGKRIVDEENRLTTKVAKVLSIEEMRERIIKSINIDSFIKYQNGNLVTDFHDPDRSVNLDKYKHSKLYSKLDIKKHEDNIYFTKVVSAFENFISFLKDDEALIDHTYLWDIVCMPNKYLFPTGVNLVIFQLPHDDITNNVQLICPTNHYSSEFYQARKPTLILIKEDGYYEPVYSYLTDGNKLTVTKEFKEYDPKLSKTMRAVFKEIVKPFFEIICRPLESMPNVYKAKRPLLLYNLIQKLDKYEYKIKKLVMNFNNKIIGVVAEEPHGSTKSGFVPCYPSALDENLKKELDYVFMTDLSLWNTYYNTFTFLDKLSKRSKKRRPEPDIPCQPAFKIVEDEHVVGILTNTNQFIQISEPIRVDEIKGEIDLPSITDEDYIVNPKKGKHAVAADVEIATQHSIDKEREDYIKKIRLETSFYNVFRNTIRILLNDYSNIKVREKIENEMVKEYILYSDKLDNINKLLQQLVKSKMRFIGDNNYYKLINEVSTCLVKDKEQCKSTPNLCTVNENGSCTLILPKKNLITGKENEPIYYGRMADEMIRYNRIKSFMLQPQTYLSFGNIGYNLRDNEIILIQSSLNQEYFETLIPAITNKYIMYNSYDETQPVITQVYDNKVPSLDKAIGRKNETLCTKVEKDHIVSSVWKKCFPKDYRETEYSKHNFCTFNFVIDLIESKTGKKHSVNEIKNQLFDEYKKYIEIYKTPILDVLIREGKKTLGDQVNAGTLSFSNLIYTDSYFLTPFDLWLLVTKYEIPTIFISQKYILQAKRDKHAFEKHEFVAYGNRDDSFAFVVVPGLRPENVPNFKLIKTDKGDLFISLNKLQDDCVERMYDAFSNKISVEEYLKSYTIVPRTEYEKKKPQKFLIESDSEDEKPNKRRKSKFIIEKNSPISSEEVVIIPKKKTMKQVIIKGEPKNITRRHPNIKKRRMLIIDSDTEEMKP